jgi:arylsulfatase
MKTNRFSKYWLVFVLFLMAFSFSGCQKSRVIYDLALEQEFAQRQGDVFIHDYLAGPDDEWLGWGWSKIRNEGTRLAVYPGSRVRFTINKAIPLYLFCTCKPFLRDEVGANSVRIKLNDKEVAVLELKKETVGLLEILIPEKDIKRGNNWVEFIYVTDAEDSNEGDRSSEDKRKFSLTVYDLILSSCPDFDLAEKYNKMSQNLKAGMRSGSFLQKVPGVMDFYLDIPAQSSLEARCAFYPSDTNGQPEDAVSFELSVKEQGEKEEILHAAAIGGGKSAIDLKTSISGEGVARLRFKAGEEKDVNSFKGFLVWSDVCVKGKSETKESVSSPPIPSELRELFAGKNIVLVIFDAARADHFSAYGHSRPTTPNTEKFAQNSTVFTNAYSEALSTRCSIGTLFTGFPLTVTSLTELTSGLPRELVTLAQLFQARGFKTTGYTGVGNIASIFRFDRGFDQYFELYKEEDFFRKSQQYLPYVLPWLEANKDKQFFLYIHFKEPHAVYKPLPPFLGMFSASYDEKVDLGIYHEMGQGLSAEQVEYIRACYDENLASVDSAFGTILDKLDELGLDKNTIVILTADHGDLLGEHGREFGHGSYFGEGVMHIPLIMRLPDQQGSKIPRKIDALVKLSDLFATLADGYRFDVPWNYIEGKSLLPLFEDSTHEVNFFIVGEKRERTGFCIRTKRNKLIFWDDAPIEFYDLAEDPQADKNIYREEDVMANYMLATLKKWIAAQELIKKAVLGKEPSEKEIEYDEIDEKILENLKALGYIK